MQFLKQLIWCVITGVLLAVLGGAAFRSYEILQAGYSLDAVPLMDMITKVMRLQYFAAYGAAAGLTFGVLARLATLLKNILVGVFNRSSTSSSATDADALIRAERVQRADQYLASLGDRSLDNVGIAPEGTLGAPDVENIITAREGAFTYRILAYRHLSEKERVAMVQEALRLGHVQEPEPGGTSTILSNVGKGGEM